MQGRDSQGRVFAFRESCYRWRSGRDDCKDRQSRKVEYMDRRSRKDKCMDRLQDEANKISDEQTPEDSQCKAGTSGQDCCGGSRHKDRSPEEIRCLTNRLKRIEGQIRGIRGMVENGAYCPDILTQAAAVTAAMNAFSRELLSSHVKTCVVEDIRRGDEDTVGELLDLLRKLMR